MPKRNFYYKMNVDLAKDAGSDLLVEIITKKVIMNIGEIIQGKGKKIIRELMLTELTTNQEGILLIIDKIVIHKMTLLKEVNSEKRKDKG